MVGVPRQGDLHRGRPDARFGTDGVQRLGQFLDAGVGDDAEVEEIFGDEVRPEFGEPRRGAQEPADERRRVRPEGTGVGGGPVGGQGLVHRGVLRREERGVVEEPSE